MFKPIDIFIHNDGDRLLNSTRRVMLHTSAAGTAADFAHAMLGKAMILSEFFERVREPVVSYTAFAAILIVYIDGRREKCHHDPSESS